MISLQAHAKVNLILDLGDRREDGRYEIRFVMQEVDLSDRLSISPKDFIEIICSDGQVPLDSRNSCCIAVEIMRKLCRRDGGATIAIDKKIPSAGGLGGGSSDAAAVMKALRDLWKADLTDDQLISAANPILGTDASFFLKGGTALVSDNGLKVEPLRSMAAINYVFVVPEVMVPANKTQSIYAQFDPTLVRSKPDFDGMYEALSKGDLRSIADRIYNAFEFSIPPHYSGVLDVKRSLREAGCINAAMCGAGPTVFGICEDEKSAIAIANRMSKIHRRVFVSKGLEVRS